MKKKVFKTMLAIITVASMVVGCGNTGDVNESSSNTNEVTVAETTEVETTKEMSEDDAWIMAQDGNLESDSKTGFEYSENMKRWYYSNFSNYKDFNEDGEIKIAFVCKEAGAWFTPKSDAIQEKCDEYGYKYTFINANSDEQTWLDGVQNIINQEYDFVILCPVNTTLLPEAVIMLQDAGIAYMTADDTGADGAGFYVPHYGLDDYALYNGAAVVMTEAMKTDGFMDNVADDYSNFMLILEDSPDIEAIHKRNTGIYDAVMAAYPDIPEDRVLWLDCGTNSGDEIMEKFSSTLEANKNSVDYWIVGAGGGYSFTANGTLFQESGIDIGSHVRLVDGVSMEDQCQAMMKNDGMMTACWGAGLTPFPQGTGNMVIINELMENGTPVPAFTGCDLILINKDTIEDFYNSYIKK